MKNPRQKICNCLFFLKASLAVLFGVAGMAYNGYKVSVLHADAVSKFGRPATSVVIDPTSTECNAPVGRAKLEPPDGTIMMGFHPDWIIDLPADIQRKVGFTPAVFNSFLLMDPTQNPVIPYNLFEWNGQLCRDVSAILSMTIQPVEVAQITDKMVEDLARVCYKINSEYGVPIMLRFGHEMNGDWTAYGYQPTSFRNIFRRVAVAVQALTNMTAMVWGPNLGINYPFTSPGALVRMPTRSSNPADFALLDTNNDGVIDSKDDPYIPYYPGDEYVDWVGLSLYWYPDENTGLNVPPPDTYFYDQLTSTGPTMELVNIAAQGDPTRNFYQRFIVERNKPFMIPETAAPTHPGVQSRYTEAEIKGKWYDQIFSTENLRRLPRMKLVTQFEEIKSNVIDNRTQDFRVLNDPPTAKAFKDIMNKNRKLLAYAPDYKVTCGGSYQKKN
ncbi:glycoside hydrolase superfamily [Globomyces pollinis-pini]|nr:glycoside hydrolase superfamily [Globomyces pollinis-pini]